LKNFEFAYKKAPYFEKVFPVLTEIILNPENNIAKYLTFSIKKICQYLDIKTEILVSSSLPKNNELKAQEKIMEMDFGNRRPTGFMEFEKE
jgi:putative cell wall-binding protein